MSQQGRTDIAACNANLDTGSPTDGARVGWIERMRCDWEERLDAMEHLLRELKKDHKLGRKDRNHGSR
jgi:hypothetical protein